MLLSMGFLEPNPDDPLNKEAVIDLQKSRNDFEKNVINTLKGVSFDKC